jgi:hypothetical protein
MLRNRSSSEEVEDNHNEEKECYKKINQQSRRPNSPTAG